MQTFNSTSSHPASTADRAGYLQQLSAPGRHWHIIVIGGGASGLGVALEAVSRGYSVLLLERFDFAKGTSSRSTKLVHGGVRYLAQGNVQLVREASVERGILRRNAPHLVTNQLFLVPVYSIFAALKYTVGLKLYDWIAGRLSFGRSVFIGRDKATHALPGIRTQGLKGAIAYHDGQFDDARLAINLAQTIREQGGDAINYLGVTAIQQHAKNAGFQVVATDNETLATSRFVGDVIVNATGVFVDAVLHMVSNCHSDTVRVSQGIHIVLPKTFYPSDQALMIPKTSDGRVLFAVPWHNHVVVGTTDTPVQKDSIEPVALEEEINFLLATAAQYFVRAPKRTDILSVFAGLRPLAAPASGKEKTKEISRSHKIVSGNTGVFTMIGGKWTTYRRMGEDMIDRIEKEKQWKPTVSVTAGLAIHGSTAISQQHSSIKKDDITSPEAGAVNTQASGDQSNASDSLWWYGNDSKDIFQRIRLSDKKWIDERYGLHEETIRWAVEYEMARTVEDMLARRTRVLFLDADAAASLAPEVARIMAALLQRDDQWIETQVAGFRSLCQSYLPLL